LTAIDQGRVEQPGTQENIRQDVLHAILSRAGEDNFFLKLGLFYDVVMRCQLAELGAV
jgi:hypothetical protein